MESFLYSPLHKSIVRHIVLTLLIVLATLAIGMSTNDLGVVLAFNVSGWGKGCKCTALALGMSTNGLGVVLALNVRGCGGVVALPWPTFECKWVRQEVWLHPDLGVLNVSGRGKGCGCTALAVGMSSNDLGVVLALNVRGCGVVVALPWPLVCPAKDFCM